jgi:hypothetical protein
MEPCPDPLPTPVPWKKRRRAMLTAATILGAGLATSIPSVQVAIETAKSVFIGGSGSLLLTGAPPRVLPEQQELLVNLAAGLFACCVSAIITYPVDTIKTRLQAKAYRDRVGAAGSGGRHGGCAGLYRGLVPSLLSVCPSASLFVAMSFGLKRWILGAPFFNPAWTVAAAVLSGALCNGILSLYRVPSDMVVKLIQTDVCATVPQALARIFRCPGALKILFVVWTITLWKTIPVGALKLGVYEGYELLLGGWLARWGCSKFLKSMCCGAAAGVTTGLLTTPIDVVMTRLLTQVHDMTAVATGRLTDDAAPAAPVPIDSMALLRRICQEIYEERGIWGFCVGAVYRACYYAPSSCTFFAVFELLRVVFTRALAPV